MCQGVLAFTRDESKSCKTEFPGENDACKRLFLFFSESRFFCNSPDGHRMLKGRRQQEKHFSWLRRSFFFSWWNCQCKTLFQFYYLFVAIILYFKNAAYIKLQRTRTQQCLKILQKVSFNVLLHSKSSIRRISGWLWWNLLLKINLLFLYFPFYPKTDTSKGDLFIDFWTWRTHLCRNGW